MNAAIIWIDREQAKAYLLTREKMERKNVTAEPGALFLDTVPLLREADKILLLGPGVAMHHFQSYLSEHHPLLARRVIGCENVEHPTDAQVADLARRYLTAG